MLQDTGYIRVTAAELVRHFGRWQEQALLKPIHITNHGRDRLVLLSLASYAALRTRGGAIDPEAMACEILLDQLAEGFISFDAGLRVTAINPVAAAYFKVMRAEMIGEKLFERIEGMRRSLIHGHLNRALQSGEIAAFDIPSAAFPGRWLHVRTFPHGRGAACLLRDISDEVASRRLADASAAALKAMAAHGGIGRGRLSPRGTFLEVDETLARMAGFSAEALTRARLTDILPLNRRVSAAREVEAVLTGEGTRAFDTALLVNDGSELAVRIALAEQRGDYACDGAVLVVTRRAEGATQPGAAPPRT